MSRSPYARDETLALWATSVILLALTLAMSVLMGRCARERQGPRSVEAFDDPDDYARGYRDRRQP